MSGVSNDKLSAKMWTGCAKPFAWRNRVQPGRRKMAQRALQVLQT